MFGKLKIFALLVPLVFLIAAGGTDTIRSAPQLTPKLRTGEGLRANLPSVIPVNKKLETRYAGKQVFIVSDKEWKDVLGLVPVAMWMEGSTLKKYPALIFHEEENGFDADSIIHFVEQYNPNSIVLIGDTPEDFDNLLIAEDYAFSDAYVPSVTYRPPELSAIAPATSTIARLIYRISPDDYIKYWNSSATVVVCEDNYASGLLASIYAARINAPLFFMGNAPSGVALEGKNIVAVGKAPQLTYPTAAEKYSATTLEEKLAHSYPTDKIILINSDDLAIEETKEYSAPFRTLRASTTISHLYSKTSLSSPFLAVGKNEFLIIGNFKEPLQVKSLLNDKVTRLGLKPAFLTIMASPPAIVMDDYREDEPERSLEVDNHVYGDANADGLQDTAVGRIFSLTSSDVSAYIARDLFIDEIAKSNSFTAIYYFRAAMDPLFQYKVEAKGLARTMRHAGFIDTSVYTDETDSLLDPKRDLEDKVFVSYFDHGRTDGWDGDATTQGLRNARVIIDPSIVISIACGTCAYSYLAYKASHPQNLFCSNIIRHGAMAHIGSASKLASSGTSRKSPLITYGLLQGNDIGHAFLKVKQISNFQFDRYYYYYDAATKPASTYDPDYILLGDPTLKIIPPSPLHEDISIEEQEVNSNKTLIRIHVNQPTEIVRISGPSGDTNYYVPPSSPMLIDWERWVTVAGYPDFMPIFADTMYWETDRHIIIKNALLRIRYSNGSEKSYILSEKGGAFYAGDEKCPHCIALASFNIGDKKGLYMLYKEVNVDFNKILPAYDYEIELETVPIHQSVPVH